MTYISIQDRQADKVLTTNNGRLMGKITPPGNKHAKNNV